MLNNRFRSRIIFMILFLMLFGFFRGALPQTFLSLLIAPFLAGVGCIAVAYAYKAWVERR